MLVLTEIIDGVEVTYYLLPVNKYDFDKNPDAAKLLFTYGSKDYFKIPVAAREVPKDTPNSSTVVRSNIALTNEQIQQTVDGVLAAMAAAEAAARAAAEARARARRKQRKAAEEKEAERKAESEREDENNKPRWNTKDPASIQAERERRQKIKEEAAAKQLTETYDRIDREREQGRQSLAARAAEKAAAAVKAAIAAANSSSQKRFDKAGSLVPDMPNDRTGAGIYDITAGVGNGAYGAEAEVKMASVGIPLFTLYNPYNGKVEITLNFATQTAGGGLGLIDGTLKAEAGYEAYTPSISVWSTPENGEKYEAANIKLILGGAGIGGSIGAEMSAEFAAGIGGGFKFDFGGMLNEAELITSRPGYIDALKDTLNLYEYCP